MASELDDELWNLIEPLLPSSAPFSGFTPYERRADIYEAFLSLACSLICLRQLDRSFC
jgi:transposase